MVVDSGVVAASKHTVEYFLKELRGVDSSGRSGRMALEDSLSAAVNRPGGVLLYCPNAQMQAKEVDVRLEIVPGRILPLRVQLESFAYHQDLDVLNRYYRELWKAYIFVHPDIFDNRAACKIIIDQFCSHFQIPVLAAYRNVREHEMEVSPEDSAAKALVYLERFIEELGFMDVPQPVTSGLLLAASNDTVFLSSIAEGHEYKPNIARRLSNLFAVQVLNDELSHKRFARGEKEAAITFRSELLDGSTSALLNAARKGEKRYATYENYRLALVTLVRDRITPPEAVGDDVG